MEEELRRLDEYAVEIDPLLTERGELISRINAQENHFSELLRLSQAPEGTEYEITDKVRETEDFFADVAEEWDGLLKKWGEIRRPRKMIEFHSLAKWSFQLYKRSFSETAKLFELARDTGRMDRELPNRISEGMLEAQDFFDRANTEYQRVQDSFEE